MRAWGYSKFRYHSDLASEKRRFLFARPRYLDPFKHVCLLPREFRADGWTLLLLSRSSSSIHMKTNRKHLPFIFLLTRMARKFRQTAKKNNKLFSIGYKLSMCNFLRCRRFLPLFSITKSICLRSCFPFAGVRSFRLGVNARQYHILYVAKQAPEWKEENQRFLFRTTNCNIYIFGGISFIREENQCHPPQRRYFAFIIKLLIMMAVFDALCFIWTASFAVSMSHKAAKLKLICHRR